MTTALVKDMDLKEAKASIARIEKGIAMDLAMDSKIGQLILDLDDRGGWMTFENDDSSRRYKNVTACLIREIEPKLDIQARQIRRYLDAAQAHFQLFGAEIEGNVQIIVDPKLKRPAIPERTTRELVRLNDQPEKQRKAWDKLMEITDGKPTAKVAAQVVDTFTGDYQQKKKKREVVQDPKLRKVALRLISSMDSNITYAEESNAPAWIIEGLARVRSSLESWHDRIKA